MYYSFSATIFRGPSFSKSHCDAMAGQISNHWVTDDVDIVFIYKVDLMVYDSLIGLVSALCQSKVVYTFFLKLHFLPSTHLQQNFETFFSKYLHLKKISFTMIKTNGKQSQITQIRPYPLACPWLNIPGDVTEVMDKRQFDGLASIKSLQSL